MVFNYFSNSKSYYELLLFDFLFYGSRSSVEKFNLRDGTSLPSPLVKSGRTLVAKLFFYLLCQTFAGFVPAIYFFYQFSTEVIR